MRRLRALLAAILTRGKGLAGQVELRDVFVFGGLWIGCHGVAMVNEAAAWMLCGLVLFMLGIRRA